VDWTFSYVLASGGLNALILGIWKPWGAAYAGEKGKNFARKEDLDIILAEVRAVTITQKEIESKLSGDLWDRQMHWNQKRDLYVELLDTILNMTLAVGSIPTIVKLRAEAESPHLELDLGRNLNERLRDYNIASGKLTKATALAAIFTSSECNTILNSYHQGIEAPDGITAQWADEQRRKLSMLLSALTIAAKNDIGIRPLVASARR